MPRNSKDGSLARYRKMIKIVDKYFECLEKPKPRIMMSSRNKKTLKEANNYVRSVDETLRILDKRSREMLINDFFSRPVKKNWWENKYSTATYYRVRDKAIKNYLVITK